MEFCHLIKSFVAGLVLLLLTNGAAAQWSDVVSNDDWESITKWSGTGKATVVHNDRIYILNKNYETDDNELWSTSNGSDWTQGITEPPIGGGDITATVDFDGYIYAFTADALWRSLTGISWKRTLSDPRYGEVISATVHDGKMFLINKGKEIWASDDGSDWTRVADQNSSWDDMVAGFNDDYLTLLSLDDKLWLICTRTLESWSSPDGKFWTQLRASSSQDPRGGSLAVYDGKIWLVGGEEYWPDEDTPWVSMARVRTSTDGVNWVNGENTKHAKKKPALVIHRGKLWAIDQSSWPSVEATPCELTLVGTSFRGERDNDNRPTPGGEYGFNAVFRNNTATDYGTDFEVHLSISHSSFDADCKLNKLAPYGSADLTAWNQVLLDSDFPRYSGIPVKAQYSVDGIQYTQYLEGNSHQLSPSYPDASHPPEGLRCGQEYVLAWLWRKADTPLTLNLYRGRVWIHRIDTVSAQDGLYRWLVPELPEGDYTIRLSTDAESDDSDLLHITPVAGQPWLRVTEPVKSVTVPQGQKMTVRWESGNLGGQVEASLYEEERFIRTIGRAYVIDGQLEWYATADTVERVCVRLKALDAPDVMDTSAGFRVRAANAVGQIWALYN